MFRSAAFSAATLLCAAAMPASAQQTVDEFKTACKLEYAQDAAKASACVTKRIVEETDRVNKLAAQMENRAEVLRRQNRCSEFILNGVDAQRFTKDQILAAYGGNITAEIFHAKSCDVARSLGF